MATIFKNPNLPDYFSIAEQISSRTPPSEVPSFVSEYEAAKVLYFPNLKFDLDFDFWAKVPSDEHAGMKKMVCLVDEADQASLVHRALRKANGPPELYQALFANMSSLFTQVMPFYYRIFGGYSYSIKRAVWRLNTTMNENLHFDTYKEDFPEHFARMFINLDNQPRIWHTSYTVDEIKRRFGHKLTRQTLESTTSNRLWRELNHAAFGNGHEWYDGQPRHVIYFDPGDVWVVDSRQVSHQIFYGRRAISIDFVVPPSCMLDADKHYLSMSETYRGELLAAPGVS